MPPRNREIDACPGVLATHQAADGAVARIRLPGGQLTATAFAVIADAAATLGNGTIELTSRANLQVRGLADSEELARRLTSVDLLPSTTHERVRNILGSALTGLDGLGRADVRDLVQTLDQALCARPALANLPGRFLFAVDDGRGDVAWLGSDVAALLTSENTAAILLGGEDVGLRLPVDDVVDTMLACAEAFLTLRTTEWRLSELADGPRRVAARSGDRSRKQTQERRRSPGAPGTPVVTLPTSTDKTGSSKIGPVGRSLVVGAPLGWLDRRQATALVATGAPLVITPWRGIVIVNTRPPLPDVGLLLDADDPLATVSACTGRPGCAKALADVRADARPIPGTALPVHWSGCERRCGRPRGTVVDMVATGDGYSMTEGDR